MAYSITPEQLVHGLAAKMRSANLDWRGSNTPWTRKLKNSIKELLQSEGTNVTEVLFSHPETDNHEFLLDIVVWDRKDGEGILLAVESEWGQNIDDIEQDFWKLLVVKSPIKLMVFGLNKKARKHTQAAVWEKLKNCLSNYRNHQKGERYVFIDFAPVFPHKAWWIEIPSNGRLDVSDLEEHCIKFD